MAQCCVSFTSITTKVIQSKAVRFWSTLHIIHNAVSYVLHSVLISTLVTWIWMSIMQFQYVYCN